MRPGTTWPERCLRAHRTSRNTARQGQKPRKRTAAARTRVGHGQDCGRDCTAPALHGPPGVLATAAGTGTRRAGRRWVQTRRAGAVTCAGRRCSMHREENNRSALQAKHQGEEKKNILHAAATIENTSIHHKESNVLSYIFLPLIFDRLLVRI